MCILLKPVWKQSSLLSFIKGFIVKLMFIIQTFYSRTSVMCLTLDMRLMHIYWTQVYIYKCLPKEMTFFYFKLNVLMNLSLGKQDSIHVRKMMTQISLRSLHRLI